MGDLLRLVAETPGCSIAGIYDADIHKMSTAITTHSLPMDCVYTDLSTALSNSGADAAIVCSTTAEHASVTEAAFEAGLHVICEKPFATNVADADRMIDAAAKAGKTLAINWPLAWYPPHITTKRLIDEGVIGEVLEVHFYDGNRGPLRHLADKVEVSEADAAEMKRASWWYDPARGGGSLLDYLGYGTTLGTWFMDGREPLTVTAITDNVDATFVDEHAIVVCRYASGLSKFETRWGTFTDPWTIQPQPKCGFVVVGSSGTISSYDYEDHVMIQTMDHPVPRQFAVDTVAAPMRNIIEHFDAVALTPELLHAPLTTKICRIGQKIVDLAVASAAAGRTLEYV
jgi:glucose-fructose oxidoreductase